MRPERLTWTKMRYSPGLGKPYGKEISGSTASAGMSIMDIPAGSVELPGSPACAIANAAIETDPDGCTCANTEPSERTISAWAAMPI